MGLAALRVAVAVLALEPIVTAEALPIFVGVIDLALAASLLLGLFTRLAAPATLLATLTFVACGGELHWVAVVAQAAEIASLSLLGAGAYSLDARLFGRRVIRLRR